MTSCIPDLALPVLWVFFFFFFDFFITFLAKHLTVLKDEVLSQRVTRVTSCDYLLIIDIQ